MDIEEAGLGPKIAWTAAKPPSREAIVGRYVRLEPVEPTRHASDLFELSHGAQGDPAIWIYMGYGPFADLAGFRPRTGRRCRRRASGHGWSSAPARAIRCSMR